MTKPSTVGVTRQVAERQLFDARRTFTHLVEMYDSGQWRTHYKDDNFANALRQAKQAVDHWSKVIRECGREGERA